MSHKLKSCGDIDGSHVWNNLNYSWLYSVCDWRPAWFANKRTILFNCTCCCEACGDRSGGMGWHLFAHRHCHCLSVSFWSSLSVSLIIPSLSLCCNKRQIFLWTPGGTWDSLQLAAHQKTQTVALHTSTVILMQSIMFFFSLSFFCLTSHILLSFVTQIWLCFIFFHGVTMKNFFWFWAWWLGDGVNSRGF